MNPRAAITFDHAVIKISNWETSNQFYQQVVGVEVISKGKGFVYRFQNAQLNLHGPGLSPTPLALKPVEIGNSDICFEWHGLIDEAITHLKVHKVLIELGPVERGGFKGTGMSVYFRDPDGALLEFISYQTK